MSREPVLLYTAHSAPMQMAFYDSDQFPAEYRNSAFIAMHGSWNRKPPSGYEVVQLVFRDRETDRVQAVSDRVPGSAGRWMDELGTTRWCGNRS